MKTKVLSVLKVIVPLLIGMYLMWYFWEAMSEKDKQSFFKAIHEANYFWFGVSLVLSFLSHLSRAYRWKYMLEPIGYKTKLINRYNALMVGYIMNLLIPRAGEASRAGVLYKTEGVPFSKSFGTIIGERIFDLIMLGVIVLLALFLNYDDIVNLIEQSEVFAKNEVEESSSGVLKYVIFGCVLLVLGFVWKLMPSIKEKIINLIRDVVSGVFSVFKSEHPWLFLLHTLFIWGMYILFFALCFYSLDETKDFPFGGVLIGFIAGTLGIMFTNGGIGAYPLLVGAVIAYYIGGTIGEDEAKGVGNALGMMIWGTQTIMMIVLGLISLIWVQTDVKKNEEKVPTVIN